MALFKDAEGKAFMPIGLQAHNSSTDSVLLKQAIRATKLVHGNTLEAPVYWDLLEPEQDRYDLSHVKRLIDEVREAGLHLIILWFGTSKNGHPNYTPEYVKLDPSTYRLAVGPDGAPVEALSMHCAATLERDRKAFARLMRFIRDYDETTHTVLAVQVENEIGYGGTDRDYGAEAQQDYLQPLPSVLDGLYLSESDRACVSEGSPWKKAFGRYAGEAFSAYYTAKFVNAVAQAGKDVYPTLPLTVNAMLQENGFEEAGLCYNAGGPVSRVLPIWRVAAPAIDAIGPDIYVQRRAGFEQVCQNYAKGGGPWYIPESPCRGEANAMNLILAVGTWKACGVFAFGAESMLDENGEICPESRDLALTFQTIAAIAPLIMKGTDLGLYAIAEDEFDTLQHLNLSGYHAEVRFLRSAGQMLGKTPSVCRAGKNSRAIRGRALLVQTKEHEFYLAGAGVAVSFIRKPEPGDEQNFVHLHSRVYSQLNFLSVEEGHFENDAFVTDFRRNGDETNYGQYVASGEMIRIRLNPCV